jgi:L-iditol 2-dehydrogenase
MLATRLTGTGEIATVEVPVPSPGPGEVLIRVEAAGVCGTDRHLYLGEFPCAPPVTLGHEFCGIVVGRGAGVDVPEGARVACDPNDWCGRCDACRRGRVNLCAANVATGIHRDGGFAEFATFPARRAVVLPDHLDPRHGAFCEPLACTLHGVDVGAPVAGERATVIGGGVIGLLAVQLARLAGAETLMLTRHPAKRALAAALGATATAATPDEARAIWPEGADLVLECAGVAETVAAAPALARAGGRVVVLGVLPRGATVPVEPFDLLFREIQLRFAFTNPFTQSRAAELIARGRVAVEPLISRETTLEEAAATIAAPARPGEVKVLVRPAAQGAPEGRLSARAHVVK